MDMRSPGGCIYFGLTHQLMKEASFPMDKVILTHLPNQEGLFIGIFMYNGVIQVPLKLSESNTSIALKKALKVQRLTS